MGASETSIKCGLGVGVAVLVLIIALIVASFADCEYYEVGTSFNFLVQDFMSVIYQV